MKAAVIGIGSNSVRMLTADIQKGRFDRLGRDREATRLFAGLDPEGNLTRDSMEKTAAAVGRMARKAREEQCEELRIFATSASRDAKNGHEFIAMVEEETGTALRIISGEEEAALSFLGATDVAPAGRRCGVIDIGGGSTELVLGCRPDIEVAMSCQMGAVRLFREYPITCVADMIPVKTRAGEILREALAKKPPLEKPEVWVGTGGTFTVLGAISRGVCWTDRTNMHGTRVSREKVTEIGETLADMSLEERLKLQSLQPARADIVVHGICILLAIMEHFDMGEIIISEYGNLDGYVRKYFC